MRQKKHTVSRRHFIVRGGLAGAGVAVATRSSVFGNAIRKGTMNGKENKVGVKSLYDRGEATVYLKSKNELDYIGMPIGGLNAGGLYLSGDGRLWLWDIFNLNQEGINPVDVLWKDPANKERKLRSRDGSSYVAPPLSNEVRPLEQGFAIKLEYEGKTITKQLCKKDWDEVSFEATYPVATITYSDKDLPVKVVMQAYSPFIPLDMDRSGLPASIFNIQVVNTGTHTVKAIVAGWLENKTALYTGVMNRVERKNSTFKEGDLTGVYATLDTTAFGNKQIAKTCDYGTLCIAALDKKASANAYIAEVNDAHLFDTRVTNEALKAAQQRLIGNVTAAFTIAGNETASVPYIVCWHFPNLLIGEGKILPKEDSGRYYDNKFANAKEVAVYVAANYKKLSSQTLLWKNTWYDATLPHWFLERTFVNISSLATTTSHRFKSGRYWAWEGVGSCQGNCTHVWHYAQATSRLFPSMEKDNRERVDLDISLQPDGGIWFRGEYAKEPAIDGQAGRVLGCYREHQMSIDNSFLQKNWDRIKRATQFIIRQDKNKDGMEDTPLENTLDAVWDGEIAWIVGLCIAAVKAGQLMAEEMNDAAFAKTCLAYVQKGSKNMSQYLFNGEYFIHRPDPVKGRQALGSYNTCHIDQVLGQSWAFQAGLGRVIDQAQTLSALKALWKYNFIEDMGKYAETHPGGRPYALYNESGLVMNTNPKQEAKPYGENETWQLGYFHECMTGFEHQVASHMMAEGMTDEALTLTRAIHDRYHAAKRNPFNEIECSDHYGRALASYGTFITACGYEYHGPRGYLRFAPKWNKDDFKAPFTTAEGWGTYVQKITGNKLEVLLDIKYGKLQLKQLSLERNTVKGMKVTVVAGDKNIPAKIEKPGNDMTILFKDKITISAGEPLKISIA